MMFHQVDEAKIYENETGYEVEIVYTTSFGDQRNCFLQFGEDLEGAVTVANAALDGTLSLEFEEE